MSAIAERAEAHASNSDTEVQPLKAVVEAKDLHAALNCVNCSGDATDGAGHRVEAFVTLIPQPDRQRMLIRAAGDGATITAVTRCEDLAGSSVTVERKRLSDLVRVTRQGSISLSAQKGGLAVRTTSGKFRLRIRYEPVDHQTDEQDATTFELPVSTVRTAIRRVRHAMAKNDVREYLNALCLETRPGELRFVATDAARIALEKVPMPALQGGSTCLLHSRTVNALRSLTSGRDGEIRIGLGQTTIWASVRAEGDLPTAHMVAQLKAGTYADYERVMPTIGDQPSLTGTVDEFRRGVEYAQVINQTSSRDKNVALFRVKSSRTLLECGTEHEGRLDLDVSQDVHASQEIVIGINADYLGEALAALEGSEGVNVVIYNHDQPTPSGFIVRSDDVPGYTAQIVERRL